jgi:hypothetical protein
MYKFSPILDNTSPFRVIDGNLLVLDDDSYKDVLNIDNSSLLNILRNKNVFITTNTITNYLKSLGLQNILNQFIINNFRYILPSIEISANGQVSIYLDSLSGFTNVELDSTTGQILVVTNGVSSPNQVVTDPISGEVIGIYTDGQLSNYETRFIQHYGVGILNNPNEDEYWYRTGVHADRLWDNVLEERRVPTNLLYCYDESPVPEGIILKKNYQLKYVDDAGIIAELIKNEEHNLQYEYEHDNYIGDRIEMINAQIALLNELLGQIQTINNALPAVINSISLIRKNHISDYISFDHNVRKGAAKPALKSSDDLYYEFELLYYCYDSADKFPSDIPIVPVPTDPIPGVHDEIEPNREYKLIYEQYIDNDEASFDRVVKEGDVVEIIFEYKVNNDTEGELTYKQVINIVVTQLITEENDIVPIRMKTDTGFIFEITIDNLVMYSTNKLITDYRILSARTINELPS